MTEAEISEIISGYRPQKGFDDLSEKPSSLSREDYAKVLKIQKSLIQKYQEDEKNKQHMSIVQRIEAVRQYQELTVKLQGIVERYWGT